MIQFIKWKSFAYFPTKSTILLFFIFCFCSNLKSQDIYKNYFESVENHARGNPNVTYDKETDFYYFVEFQESFQIPQYDAFNIKKIDANGNFITSFYFPYYSSEGSHNYISTMEIQGDDLVIFLSRNTFSPDVYIVRVKKDLLGGYSSNRYFYPENDNLTSIRISDSRKLGNKIIFTGSAFLPESLDSEYDKKSKLLVGIINEDQSIDVKLFNAGEYKIIEGLNIHTTEENNFYIGGRYSTSNSLQHPLLIKANLGLENSINIEWSNVYRECSKKCVI